MKWYTTKNLFLGSKDKILEYKNIFGHPKSISKINFWIPKLILGIQILVFGDREIDFGIPALIIGLPKSIFELQKYFFGVRKKGLEWGGGGERGCVWSCLIYSINRSSSSIESEVKVPKGIKNKSIRNKEGIKKELIRNS